MTANDLTPDFQNLHAAALRLSTRMLATLDDKQRDWLAKSTRQGGRVVVEVEVPDCQRVSVVLVEIEGRRRPVCSLGKKAVSA